MKSRRQSNYGEGPKKSGWSAQDSAGIAIIFVALLAAGAVAFWVSEKSSSIVRYDPATYCPIKGPFGKTVLLIDLTDEISFLQERKLKNYIKSLSDSSSDEYLPLHNMLAVYLLDESDTQSIPVPIFEACNPGDGTGLSEFDGNPIQAHKRFTERFLSPINMAIAKIVATGGSKTSPIIESIRGISVSAFDESPQPGHNHRLVVISDMLQNSTAVTHYGDGQGQSLGQLRSVGADLDSVSIIDIKVLDRENLKKLQGKQLLEFWSQYFRASGSSLNSADRWTE